MSDIVLGALCVGIGVSVSLAMYLFMCWLDRKDRRKLGDA